MKDVKKLYSNSIGQTRPKSTVIKSPHRRQSIQNKSFTPTVVELSASVDEEFNNIIYIRKIS